MYRDVGASWWKVDFHAHSPASFDFGTEEGGTGADKPTFKEWLQAYMDSGVDAIVITDHNSAEGIEQARNALKEMRPMEGPRLASDPPSPYREMALFTGVEITVATGIHLLGVFDVDTHPNVITKVLTLAGYGGRYGYSREAASKSISQVAKIIHENGGLAIPAHADDKAGVLSQTSTGLSEVERNAPIFAIETTNPETKFEATGFRKLVRVLGSDAHHLDGTSCPEGETAKYPGSHFTWIKMGTPSLAGIRNALSDGTASVRTSDCGVAVDGKSHPRVTSIRFGNTELEFNPWLNTIIGGRGVGKSTAVEMIRVAMDRFGELSPELTRDLQWFSPSARASGEERAWSKQGIPEVTYLKDGHTYRISWDEQLGPSAKELDNGSWNIAPGDIKTRFPIRIYSQKQIFELAKNPQALIGIIDGSPEVNFAAWGSEHQRTRDDYRRLSAEADGYRDTIENSARVSGLIQDLERKIAAAEDLSASRDVLELRRLQEVSTVLQTAVEETEAFLAAMHGLRNTAVLPTAVSQDIFESEDSLSATVSSAQIALTEISDSIQALAGRAETVLEDLSTAVDNADYAGRIGNLQQRIADAAGENTAEDVLRSLALVSQWTLELSDAQKELVHVERAKKLLAEIEPLVNAKRTALEESRNQLSQRRSDYLSSLEASTPNVEVKLHQMGDSANLERDWRRLLKKDSSFDRSFSPEGFFKAAPDGRDPRFKSWIAELKKNTLELAAGREVEDLFPDRKIDQRLVEHIRGLSRSDLEEIEAWFPEDSVQVRYKSDDNARWTPISAGSPGQRTAALLAFVLAMGTEPLILDQPEDDLENQLIYSLVVGTLKSIKSSRQVIVVTHNANIVVNGNAENVIVLNRSLSDTSVYASGALETADIRGAVCQIMEGGETAFTKRFERLGVRLPAHIRELG